MSESQIPNSGTNNQTPATPPPLPKKWGPVLILGAIVVVVVLVIVLLWIANKNKTSITGMPQPTAESIRQNFPTPTPTPTPKAHPTTTTSPGPVPSHVTLYQNSALGFQMQLNSNWQTQTQSTDTVIFKSNAGQSFSVQVLISFWGTIQDVQKTLTGSTSVKSVNLTNFGPDPALDFITKDGKSNSAVIHESKLYYILGASYKSFPLSTFSFLN